MKRVLCAATLLAAAALATPATAYEPYKLSDFVTYQADDQGVGVGTRVGRQPLVGARWDRTTGEICVGFSYQIPQCVGGPIE